MFWFPGMTLNYKSENENSQWHESLLESDNNSYVLKGLYCGTRYHIFMTAHNQEGSSGASNIEVVNTQGFGV